ncbi:glycoside hydrolase family 43 protein [Spirochaeta cellobiosiphila]|uniref:glycoside hydrolase family 43 protein n=1 Tax=Spirochaeta cellobiosiphila TaxID=504483 RepID=UPI0004259AA7|nr:glycoside hydrolase family 43 protein [Spirochaeta cellobiosiphila]
MQDKPLITHMYTADPSAKVFQGRVYLYPSHDRDIDKDQDDLGTQYEMEDYHVFSMDSIPGEVVDHGLALHVDQVPWATKQMWAPDAMEKDGKYYLYFPAKDKEDIFRVGVAVSDQPGGPFKAEPEPIKEMYSIDPAVFKDDDKSVYLYSGGLWGGQLENWRSGSFNPDDKEPGPEEKALCPIGAKLKDNMLEVAHSPVPIQILDEEGNPLKAGDEDRRYFEDPWVHKYKDLYYLSYSTGTTHYLVYATSTNPLGPFTYRGRILNPVLGWTTHHSIVEFQNRWYLFYHDCELSGGINHKRNVKVREFFYNSDGSISLMDP